MSAFKNQSNLIRAKDALAQLFELAVHDKKELNTSLAELASMNSFDVMIELQPWRVVAGTGRQPEWQHVLQQHGF